MEQNELRERLGKRLKREKASYICQTIGINKDVLSKFKNNKIDLHPYWVEKLEKYLNNESEG